MLGLRSDQTRSKPMATKPERSSPTLMPDEKKIDRKVFLVPEQWERLSAIAEFHGLAFKKMGRDQSVSRNDIIENFLQWAEDEYWAEKGGKPKNFPDREKKIAAFAERLKAKEAKARADQSSDGDGSPESR